MKAVQKNNSAVAPSLTIALFGNPNSGKTTLFNALTGSNQKIGNWAGVTVEKKSGQYKNDKTVTIVDTPGIYSLCPQTLDEQIAYNFLIQQKPDLVINIVDSTNLRRNLFLTCQLLEQDIPVVVALNMTDEAEAMGLHTNFRKLQEHFGCPFFPISASKSQGIDKLMDCCLKYKPEYRIHKAVTPPTKTVLQGEKKLNAVELATQRYLRIDRIVSLVQKDNSNIDAIKSQPNNSPKNNATQQLSCDISTHIPVIKKKITLSEGIDRVVLNKWLAFPILAIVMTLIFYLSMGGLGQILSNLISGHLTPFLLDYIAENFVFTKNQWLMSLLTDGVLKGVLSVISFLPQVMLLFGLIAVLEASGYMSRIAFVMDSLLNFLGLNGKSFVSIVLGCGCSVPAIMATRTIKNIDERNATITLAPFMPCSAKMAVISFFTAQVFGGNALTAVSFYFLSIATIILAGLILKLFCKKDKSSEVFVLELPNYRLPTLKNIGKQMWERGKSFLLKAGTVILLMSILMWFLQRFNFAFEYVPAEQSIIAQIGKLIAPLFAPLGFGDWQFAVATLSGIAAKETVVSTLNILLNGQDISQALSPLSAYCFVAYNLLTVPCVSAISASFSEQGSLKKGLKSAGFQMLIAYAVTILIYQFGMLAIFYTPVVLGISIILAIAFVAYLSAKYLITRKPECSQNCTQCSVEHCDMPVRP